MVAIGNWNKKKNLKHKIMTNNELILAQLMMAMIKYDITFRDHVFRSESAIRMLNDMCGLE